MYRLDPALGPCSLQNGQHRGLAIPPPVLVLPVFVASRHDA